MLVNETKLKKLHSTGKETLKTVALRPTLLYGEGDTHLIPLILKIAKNRNNCLPRISGAGGKQQITYVGEFFEKYIFF